MADNREKERQETEKANKRMNREFKDYGTRATSEATTDAEKANQQIQQQFYKEEENNDLLPFHIDINNPPIKK